MITAAATAVMLFLAASVVQAQTVTVTYPDGTVAFAYPADQGGTLRA